MKLCCGETWGVAQARWKPAEESAESSSLDEARSSAAVSGEKYNKNRRSWGRQIDRRIRKPQHGSRCLDGNVESVM